MNYTKIIIYYNILFFNNIIIFCLTYHLLGKNPLFFYYILIIFIWCFKILRQTSDISCQTLMQASSFPTFSPRCSFDNLRTKFAEGTSIRFSKSLEYVYYSLLLFTQKKRLIEPKDLNNGDFTWNRVLAAIVG